MNKTKERGVALILALILVLVLSVMAVSLMFLSQTETWSSMSYRIMSSTGWGGSWREQGRQFPDVHRLYAAGRSRRSAHQLHTHCLAGDVLWQPRRSVGQQYR